LGALREPPSWRFLISALCLVNSGIFALGTGSHAYLEFNLKPGIPPIEMVRSIASLRAPSITTGGVNLVVAFRPELWGKVAPDQIPAHVVGFNQPLHGVEGFTMPATQHDLWLWVAGHAYERVFDAAREAIVALDASATLVSETDGWTYKGNRDLTGFIDGSENPSLVVAPEVALIPDGFPGAGGSVVLVQKWMHNSKPWEALPVREQEKAIGRTKDDSTELSDEVRGLNSHVPRNVIVENGKEQHIFRRNSPFGTPGEHGTMFVGFSADQHRLSRMLNRMPGVEDGIRDKLTYFTTPVTGAYYFVPSVQALRQFATDEEQPCESQADHKSRERM
jgi:porphyrinogen peroxidase